ncbi:MAG TPA: hypothetical protein HA349_11315 [Methanotrichaceae archaeon]|nr:hypothetical protein [Methanotrichaceae archaeon]
MKAKGGRRVEFSMWLFEQRKRDDRVGSVAFDAYQEHQSGKWPDADTFQDYLDHMLENRVRGAPLKALDQAWWEYIDVVTRDVAQHYLLLEVGAVMERALLKAEHLEDGDRYIIDGAYVERLEKLMAKLKEI